MTYEFAVEDCDVADKVQLADFRLKRTEWLHLLNGDPDHAVWRQIAAMLWNDAVFRMANEARRLSHQAGYESSARNSSLARFIDQGFVATQTLSIRKLMEKRSTNPAKQVVSLRRVLDDIKMHRHLITREHYVAHDGLPYDPEPGERAESERILKQINSGGHAQWMSTSGPEAWFVAQSVHERFDKLSGVSAENRTRDDLIREEVFEKIEAILTDSGWKEITNFGNKFIAHAADENSRSLPQDGQSGFSLDKLARCHEGICRAATAIYGPILWEGSRGLIPIPQFDHFEDLDAPWLLPADVESLSNFWHAHVKRVESWAEGDPLA